MNLVNEPQDPDVETKRNQPLPTDLEKPHEWDPFEQEPRFNGWLRSLHDYRVWMVDPRGKDEENSMNFITSEENTKRVNKVNEWTSELVSQPGNINNDRPEVNSILYLQGI